MESYIMNLYRHIDREKVQFDFVVGDGKYFYESEILSMGGEIYRYKTGIKCYKYYLLPRIIKISVWYLHLIDEFFPFLFLRWYHILVYCDDCRCEGSDSVISHNTNRTGLAAVGAVILKPFLRFVATQRWACGQGAGEWLFGKQCEV